MYLPIDSIVLDYKKTQNWLVKNNYGLLGKDMLFDIIEEIIQDCDFEIGDYTSQFSSLLEKADITKDTGDIKEFEYPDSAIFIIEGLAFDKGQVLSNF